MKALTLMLLVQSVLLTNGVVSSSVSFNLGAVKLFEVPASYDVETTLFLNDISRTEKEVSYKIKGQLTVQPVWRNADSEFLLKLQLVRPQLYLRGKHHMANFRAHPSVWDSHDDSPFYVHWKKGLIENSYLNPKELPDFINYKKTLISLFQVQIIDGEYNETDISGPCHILYESLSEDVFRKIKRGCEVDGALTPGRARRLSRYTLRGGALHAVHAEELLELGHAAVGVKARSWHRLQASAPASASAPAPAAASLGAALAALPADLAPATLTFVDTDIIDDDLSLEEALSVHRSALAAEGGGAGAGGGGGVEQARAALQLLPAMRAAALPALRKLLEHPDNYSLLVGLCRLLGLTGTRAAHAAVDALVHMSARDPLQPHTREYLAGAALARAPAPGLAADLAKLAEDAKDSSVAAAAHVAAAAAASKLPPPAADLMKDRLAKGLARCKEESCRVTKLRALGVLRHAESCELLLEHAERGARAPALAALAGLRALHDAAPRALHYARRLRLQRIATAPAPARPLEVRAAALDLVMLSSASRPAPLAGVGVALLRGPRELRRLYWDRLRQLAHDHGPVRDILPMLPPELNTWDTRALAGTSSVLARAAGWAAAGWRARLHSVQVAADGLLRRGAVTLRAERDAERDAGVGGDVGGGVELVAVEVWTRGLGALAGGGGGERPDPDLYEGDEDEEQEVSGGLSLSVGGVQFPDVELFSGQAELLAHVWAGAGSEPTPVLRAAWPAPAHAHADVTLPILAGVTLRYRWDAVLALALDAHATVSLWSRSARAGLQLRAGAAAWARADVTPAWGRLTARDVSAAAPRLHVHADLDFYSRVALCVRTHTADHALIRESELTSEQGARDFKVVRRRNATRVVAGRTLQLGARNDRECAAMPAAD